jgi:glycosyltransferase involved in cell wall biosynthesis
MHTTELGARPPPRGDRDQASPRLAVLIPVYNAQSGFERSLASLARDGERFDVVAVDDGSAPPIAVPPELPFSLALLRLEQNGGITRALNAGLHQIIAAGYTYVARLDADDQSLPGRFAAQMAFLDRHPDHAVVGAQAEFVDAQGQPLFQSRRPTDHHSLIRYMCYQTGLVHPSTMIRVQAMREHGLYSDAYRGAEDYELWLRLSRHYRVANLPDVYVRKEVSASQITARRMGPALSRLRLQLRYFTPGSLHAYGAVIWSLGSLLLPRKAALRIRRWRAGPAERAGGERAG